MTWVAYADESIASTTEGGAYILAAATMDRRDCAAARYAVAALGRPRARFHWRDARPDHRHEAVKIVGELAALHLVVIATHLDFRKQERARRFCLRRLLDELEDAKVDHLWLETRTQSLNARDVKTLDIFRSSSTNTRIRVDHALPVHEPLLWIPDIVAGAINLALNGDATHQTTLEPLISKYELSLR